MSRPSLLVVPVEVAALLSAPSTEAALAPVWDERYRAPVPPECGEAIDVPDLVVVPPPFLVERMLTPGAHMSTQEP